MALRVDYDRWRLSWQSRYLGSNIGYHDFEPVFGDVQENTPSSSTCLGPPTDMQCKDVETAPDYWIHHAALTYRGNEWQIVGGLRNVFDKAPPQVDRGWLWTQNQQLAARCWLRLEWARLLRNRDPQLRRQPVRRLSRSGGGKAKGGSVYFDPHSSESEAGTGAVSASCSRLGRGPPPVPPVPPRTG